MSRRLTDRDGLGGTDRGQTLIDFGIGVGLFLIAVAVVFTFVPGMLDPFTADQENIQLADRTASQFAQNYLSQAGQPYVLDADCTDEFFDADGSVGSCPYPTDAADLTGAVNADATTELNLTVVDSDGAVVDEGVGLAAGPVPPTGTESVTTARRGVHYRGRTYQLVVRVW